MPIDQRQQELVDEFSDLSDWEERYRRIIEMGRELPHLPEDLKVEKYRVRGCQSQVWLHAGLGDNSNVMFRADSDAMIVRGLIAMLLHVYSNAPAEEILKSPPDFIKEIGLAGHLSPTRTNGLHSLVEQIMYYAKAFHTLAMAQSGGGN